MGANVNKKSDRCVEDLATTSFGKCHGDMVWGILVWTQDRRDMSWGQLTPIIYDTEEYGYSEDLDGLVQL